MNIDKEWAELVNKHEEDRKKYRVADSKREKRQLKLDMAMTQISMIASMPSPALMALNPNLSKEFVTEQIDKHNDRLKGLVGSVLEGLEGDL